MVETQDIDIYVGPGDKTALEETIEALKKLDGQMFAVQESLTHICFPERAGIVADVEKWPKGRIFCDAFDFSWWLNETGFHSTLAVQIDADFPFDAEMQKRFHKSEKPLDAFQSRTNLDESGEKASKESTEEIIYLWAPDERRLGKPLEYESLGKQPSSKKNVRLLVRKYFDQYGRLIFWRYRKMEWCT
ncbi:MAG: hypothetical protein ACE5IR_22175 [bacterium]